MVLINKVFIGQAEIRVGQEMPVVVTNSGKNQLILIQKKIFVQVENTRKGLKMEITK